MLTCETLRAPCMPASAGSAQLNRRLCSWRLPSRGASARPLSGRRHTSTVLMAATLQSPPALGGPRIQKKVEVPSNLQPAGELERVPGGKGRAVKLQAGQYLKVTNTHGEQVVDFFGFGLPDIRKEMMSMHHTHDAWGSLVPKVGDTAVTNLRRPIFTLVEDTGPGVHDTTVAACDQYLYIQQIGPEAAKEHDSCINNLHTSLKRDVDLTLTDDPDNYPPPAPFNLWMAVSLGNNGTELSWDPPAKGQKAGDHVLFKVEMDCVAAMSACPHDLSPINGKTGPNDVHFQVFNVA